MITTDYAYYVVADWPASGQQIWRAGLFDTESEARREWDRFAESTPSVRLVSINRIEVPSP